MNALRKLLNNQQNQISPRQFLRFAHNNQSNNGNENSSDKGDLAEKETETVENTEIPAPPNNCCMSGCANCVWIQYADELHEKMQHGTKLAREVINKEVDDANMRAYLEMELRILEKNKNDQDKSSPLVTATNIDNNNNNNNNN